MFLSLTQTSAASLWSAIAADTGASLLVVFNALRLTHGNWVLAEKKLQSASYNFPSPMIVYPS
ncbi:MAG: hypothetical protein IT428_25140 [Planctomycetaceae bacterium]|nr:hypothetical protein [Planctomycetaceae bacterium]